MGVEAESSVDGHADPGAAPAPAPDVSALIGPGRRVCVAGVGVSGAAVARVLLRAGAEVTVVDATDTDTARSRGAALTAEGATVELGDGGSLPPGTDLVVTSPGWRPDSPLLLAAAHAGVPVWGDVELAWRLRTAPPVHGGAPPAPPARWLAVTGTNGKTTTVRMLAAMLSAHGLRAAAVGNVGVPVVEAVTAAEPYDVLAIELSSFQLHWAPSIRPYAGAVLNVAVDHLDWHGGMAAYAAAKGRVYHGAEAACVYNTADPTTEELVRAADVAEGCRAIGFTLGAPAPGQLGVVEDLLVDRAFTADPHREAVELAAVADVSPAAPHNVANALAAAALARSAGVSPEAVRAGLRSFRPDAHRIAHVATLDGVTYIDDSKATNPHAAEASLVAHPSAVWIAGGLAKGATFDDLVRNVHTRLRGVVLMGRDRGLIADAVRRHAPDVPVVDVPDTHTGAMATAVAAARNLARAGDTVLLAPACASMDMFTDYGDRGRRFVDAVQALAGTAT